MVARLPLPAVHKLIERGVLRPRRVRVGRARQRMLSREQVLYLSLEAEGLRLLPLPTRRAILKKIESSRRLNRISVSDGSALVVDVKPVRQRVQRELDRLAKAEKMAESNPDIQLGSPCYKGTRIPVDVIADILADGATLEEILEGYPSLTREMIELAPLYVRAFPRRGRPAPRPWAKLKPVQVGYFKVKELDA